MPGGVVTEHPWTLASATPYDEAMTRSSSPSPETLLTRAREICSRLTELSSAEIADVIDTECGGDVRLREYVIALVGPHGELGDLLHSRGGSTMDMAGALPRSGPGHLAQDVFGPYALQAELGAGGQGRVYLAQDTRLERQVALKVMPEGHRLSDHSRRRFHREALAASKLDHPGICTVFEVGEQDSVPFLAMQYIPGASLDRRIRHRESSDSEPGPGQLIHSREQLDEVLAFFESVADALHFAHEGGLVHRDIKPANIMVAEDGRGMVLDFGLGSKKSTRTLA